MTTLRSSGSSFGKHRLDRRVDSGLGALRWSLSEVRTFGARSDRGPRTSTRNCIQVSATPNRQKWASKRSMGSVMPMPNRLARETSPYLLQHRDNPVDWYPWGEEALARAHERGPADPALGRLLGLPLVPRDGARVLRGRRDGGLHERALRQRQGRPRGAPRRRRPLHGGGAGDQRPGRLADDRLPRPRGRAVLRRHLLPAGRGTRDAELPDGDGSRRRRLRAQARRDRESGRPRCARGSGRSGRSSPPRSRRTAAMLEEAVERLRDGRRRRARRLRRRAQVPAGLGAGAAARPRQARAGREDSRRDARRRHLRPARRRLRPLLGRRGLARPPLREDALRQRPARPRLPARLAGRSATSATGGPARRRSTGRCARCAAPRAASTRRSTPTPRARRAASTSGRRRRSETLETRRSARRALASRSMA